MKSIFFSCAVSLLASSSIFGIFEGPFHIQYGTNIYLHDTSGVIADAGASSVGNLVGVNVNASWIDPFFNDLFFYRFSASFDYALPKIISVSNIQSTINQLRVEAPLLFGISLNFDGHKAYIATGINFTYYRLSHTTRSSDDTRSTDLYNFLSWGLTSVAGLMIQLPSTNTKKKSKKKSKRYKKTTFQQHFFLEIQYSRGTGTGKLQTNIRQSALGENSDSDELRNVQINLSDLRWNIGYSHSI